jgi:hypothetical protein
LTWINDRRAKIGYIRNMDQRFCPGARVLRQPRPEIFACPDCGEEVEIWSDEIRGTCQRCGRAVFREGLPSCVEWCKYGKECVGEEAFGRHQRNRALGIKRGLLEAIEAGRLPGAAEPERRRSAAHWAQEILSREGGDWHLVIPAVLIHDGALSAGAAGEDRAEDLPRLLLRQGLGPDDVEAILALGRAAFGAEDPGEGLNGRIARDAWLLVEIEAARKAAAPEQELRAAEGRLSTVTAKSLARELLSSRVDGGTTTCGKKWKRP